MSLTLLVLNLVLVVAMLLGVLWTGLRGRREAHYALAITTVLLLLMAIFQAELYGRGFSFAELPLQVHLWCAFAALGSLPGVIWSGLRLLKDEARRRIHRRWVALFVVLVLLSVGTACWMFVGAEALTNS